MARICHRGTELRICLAHPSSLVLPFSDLSLPPCRCFSLPFSFHPPDALRLFRPPFQTLPLPSPLQSPHSPHLSFPAHLPTCTSIPHQPLTNIPARIHCSSATSFKLPCASCLFSLASGICYLLVFETCLMFYGLSGFFACLICLLCFFTLARLVVL